MSSLEGEPEKNTFSKFTLFKKASRFEMCLFKQPAGGESRSCKKTCGCIDIYGEKKNNPLALLISSGSHRANCQLLFQNLPNMT